MAVVLLRRTLLFVFIVMAWSLVTAAVSHSAARVEIDTPAIVLQ